jgi:hypothetical protein
MEMTTGKAVAAVLTGLATIAATVFGVNTGWFTPELSVTIGSALTALLVYLVPNKEVEPA